MKAKKQDKEIQYRLPGNLLQDLPQMVSIKDIQQALSCSRMTATRIVLRLPRVNLAMPGAGKQMYRVPRCELFKFLSQNVHEE